MKGILFTWINTAFEAFDYSIDFIIWNSFLAFIPLVLSIWLFRKSRSRSWIWWLSFLTFLVFLPNSPYVLTDIVHLIELIRFGYSVWIVTLILIPQYLIFILAGVEAYVISLINLGYYLHQEGKKQYIFWVEIIIHALCAIGIYLGRFKRFNSWDFITQPDNVFKSIADDLTTKYPLAVIFITFLVLTILYWLLKQVNLGLILQLRYQNSSSRKEE
jgi:uncharacterized membrane protein